MQYSAVNQDIIRGILLWASTADSHGEIEEVWPKEIAGLDNANGEHNELVAKHLNYLNQKGWIKARQSPSDPPYTLRNVDLLPEGWDFLDSIMEKPIT